MRKMPPASARNSHSATEKKNPSQRLSAGYYEFSQRSAEWLKRPGNYLPLAPHTHTLRPGNPKKMF